jgi:tRNA G18 (ribose-2'-O)-methylase SpoU
VRVHEVTDPADPAVAVYATLRDGELGAHERRGRGVFVVEGPNPVRELLASGWGVDSMFVEAGRIGRAEALVGDRDVLVHVAQRQVFRDVVRFRLHQGVVALGLRPDPLDVPSAVAGVHLVAAFEEVNDHENLGVVFRSARALGVGAVVLGPRSCDPLYRRCVRVSMGHALHVPFATGAGWPEGVAELSAAGLRTVALATSPDAVPLDELADGVPSAVLLGAEGPGLTAAAVDAADVVARIPMAPGVDSLNVGVAASIAFHVLGPRSDRR